MTERETSSLSDSEVIHLVRKGHVDYFRILIDRYQKRVFSIGMRFLRNQEDTLDFCQDVFLRAYEALPGFKGYVGSRKASFAGWITRIAYRHGINTINRRKTYISLAEEYEPVSGESPETRRLKKNIRDSLQAAVKGLSEYQAMCLDLFFFYGLKYNDISDITGIPVNTVKSHVFRAKKLLKTRLQGTEAEDYHEL